MSEIVLGAAGERLSVQHGALSNRHGLIAGATGTGKTVSLQIMAEGFSRAGVAVFAADIKGDLSGLAKPGERSARIDERLQRIPLPVFQNRGYPVVLWDLFGEQGHPMRTTVSEMGPLLLSTLLELNDTQTGALYAAFRIADDNGLLLLDLKDLRAMLAWVGDNAAGLRSEYGNIAPASIGAIQRKLLVLEEQGAERFLGEPSLRMEDLLVRDFSGNGVIHLLDATRLTQRSPRLYASFLLWLLSDLFERLPEVGDPPVPRLVFFFDEAHLLFNLAPKPLLERIEQVVRLIRSKGVGVYFITQSPMDVPEAVLGQLGLRVQHALRAFTPKDRQAIRAVAANFRPNPGLDTASTLTELATGEALISALDLKGAPTPVERVLIRPPESRIGPLSDEERRELLGRSPLAGRYDTPMDRESAYEVLARRAAEAASSDPATAAAPARRAARAPSNRQSVAEALVKSVARSAGSQLGRQIMRGLLGSLFGGKR